MAGVADAATDEERAQRGLGQQARGHVVRELAAGGHAVHFAELVGPDGVDFFANEWWQRKEVTQVAGPTDCPGIRSGHTR